MIDRWTMLADIGPQIVDQGQRIVLGNGPGGEVWADLYAHWDQEEGWDVFWETNLPEWVGLKEIYEHLHGPEEAVGGQPLPCQIGGVRPGKASSVQSVSDCAKDRNQPCRPDTSRRIIDSPYLNAGEAAQYLGMTVKALYGHVERGKLRPMPGYRKYRFTTEQLDNFLRGEQPNVRKATPRR